MSEYVENNENYNKYMTIEKRLEIWAQCSDDNGRFAKLWHGWNQNKSWLSQLLELTLPSFPTYSRHDESHCKNVLQNMERILGSDRIMKLSATDCFMLLHVAYVHDLSMAITSEQRLKIAMSDDFVKMVLELENSSDTVMSHCASMLSNKINLWRDSKNLTDREKAEKLKDEFMHDIEIFQAVILVFGEYERRRHGSDSANKLRDLINDPEKLGSGFSISGIPMRIFYRIADCAELHTDWDLHNILNLPKEDSGYSLDTMHPRFVAVMLQLGDALDMDNDRFHLFARDFIGTSTAESKRHYDKHSSIRNLQINSKEIYIEANCPTQDALRLIRNECDALERILQFASYHWADISPKEIDGCLPTLQPPKLLLVDKIIPKELVDTKFLISQEKAFSLLEGSNVYNCNFPFLRELLQNAIDATKIQYWTDVIHEGRIDRKDIDKLSSNNALDMGKMKFSKHYPIRIELRLRRRNSENEYVEVKNDDFERDISNNQIGVLMNIIDYGTGISDKDILDISEVGTSFNKKKKLLHYMPEWLFPTGEFGVGLQSVFLITNQIKAQTHTRKGHCYDIYFTQGSKNGKGYINVEPISTSFDDYRPYGTNFQIFISNKNRLNHLVCSEAWNGKDPFTNDFEKMRPLRHANELLNQLLVTLDDLIGNLLFPIEVFIESKEFGNFSFDSHMIRETKYNLYELETSQIKNGSPKPISWFYQLNNNNLNNDKILFTTNNKDIYIFDFDTCKLYIWDDEIQTCITVSAINLFKKFIEGKNDYKTNIYYKGIYLSEKKFDSLNDIIETIDIKGGINKSYLQLNRNGFTDEGYNFVETILYPHIQQKIYTALEYTFFSDEFIDKLKKFFSCERNIIEAEENIFKEECYKDLAIKLYSLLFYILFYKYSDNKSKTMVLNHKMYHDEEYILNHLYDFYKDLVKDYIKDHTMCNYFENFFDIDVLLMELNLSKTKKHNEVIVHFDIQHKLDNLFLILKDKNKYGVVSIRNKEHKNWRHSLMRFANIKNDFQLKNSPCENLSIDNFLEYDNIKLIFERMDDKFFDVIEQFQKVGYDKLDRFSQWLLHSLPTVAMGANNDANIRINFLSTSEDNFIFVDSNLRAKTYDRIESIYKEMIIERFAIISSPKYHYISIRRNQLPKSVYPVTRGYMSNRNQMMIIIPFTGEKLSKIFKSRNDEYKKYEDFLRQVENILIDGSKKIKKEAENKKMEMYNPRILMNGILNREEIEDEECIKFIANLGPKNLLDKIKKLYYNFTIGMTNFINQQFKISGYQPNFQDLMDNFFSEKVYNQEYIRDMCVFVSFMKKLTFRIFLERILKASKLLEELENIKETLTNNTSMNLINYVKNQQEFVIREEDVKHIYEQWMDEFENEFVFKNTVKDIGISRILLDLQLLIDKDDEGKEEKNV